MPYVPRIVKKKAGYEPLKSGCLPQNSKYCPDPVVKPQTQLVLNCLGDGIFLKVGTGGYQQSKSPVVSLALDAEVTHVSNSKSFAIPNCSLFIHSFQSEF
jgi:hypothetical protein